MSWHSGWRLAVGTLTILPAGSVTPSPAAARWMVALAPAAALPLALGAAGLTALGAALEAPHLITGLLAVGWLALTTRGMHLDAVSDVADGSAAAWEPPRARMVLKRGDIGPMGVVALGLTIGLQAAAIGALSAEPRGWLVVGVLVATSRWLLAPVCVRSPAMPGSSLGAVYAGSVPGWQAVLWSVLGLVLITAAVCSAGAPWWFGPAAWLPGLAAVIWLRAHALRTFEGINGDVLGAAIELGLTTGLVVLACR